MFEKIFGDETNFASPSFVLRSNLRRRRWAASSTPNIVRVIWRDDAKNKSTDAEKGDDDDSKTDKEASNEDDSNGAASDGSRSYQWRQNIVDQLLQTLRKIFRLRIETGIREAAKAGHCRRRSRKRIARARQRRREDHRKADADDVDGRRVAADPALQVSLQRSDPESIPARKLDHGDPHRPKGQGVLQERQEYHCHQSGRAQG